MEKRELAELLVPFFEETSSSSSSQSSSIIINKDRDSDSSDEEYFSKFCKGALRKRTCIKKYFEDLVLTYSEEEFRRHFRISRSLFLDISQEFGVSPEFESLQESKRISASKHIAVFLWFAGHEACSYRDIADRFDLSLWAVEHIIERVINYLSGLCDEVFKWPDERRKEEISNSFKEKTGFPKVIGAIDGTHIVIDPPQRSKDDYIDRRGHYSLCLQGICDNNKKFIDICIGYPGSVHDSRVLKNSPIFPKLENLCGGYCILGDSAYPCLPFLLTPYRDNGNLDRRQKLYNKKLSSCRVVIEHTFGILKQRFRQLYYCKLRGIPKICHFIRACCVLHNLADEDEITMDIEAEIDMSSPDSICEDEYNSNRGKAIRNQFCEELWRLEQTE